MLKIIAAVSENGVIGNDGGIPWKLSDDMRRFKEKTGNCPIVMGSKTYWSLPNRFRPLPGRENLVLTRHPAQFEGENVTMLDDFLKVVARAKEEEVWVIGGAEIYKLALPYTSEMHITRVDLIVAGDTFFPRWNDAEWRLVSAEEHEKDRGNERGFTWEIWGRV
ncbi:MAG: hypothetical protein A2758_00270 [Candidatus Zambryskibacteria bacterium RIFCSPHIGHO2_01_FULL_49_18]|uniref:Dihydrofolate reductase n=2 Tax=Candidatus Zambryskiibacteriota TaxID=1817925 RepID=A0A1G2T2L9_9BACT|nr:MAG: hypothetical protein A2758_00270 [Candidatus Zambryskibacteria bacterium RIFCSPHIGHO2_01_FULL_49_18]OHB05682.1 MAG: hypothetical protein A3A26_02260 [Candidatus Zambryskibacteria bacterium RIFCSPLOWO2_01_FULL_47_14]